MRETRKIWPKRNPKYESNAVEICAVLWLAALLGSVGATRQDAAGVVERKIVEREEMEYGWTNGRQRRQEAGNNRQYLRREVPPTLHDQDQVHEIIVSEYFAFD